MPSLKSLRNRIKSVKSTQQITKAMKMVAAARLRRAQEAVLSARPYAKAMQRVLDGVGGKVNLAAHPLLQRRELKKIELVVMTSDRGLCGGFNANVVRRVQRFLLENNGKFEKVTMRTIGRKGHDALRRQGANIRKDHPGLLNKLSFDRAEQIALELTDLFLSGEVDGVFLVYNEFVSAVSQRVTLAELLPIAPNAAGQGATAAATEYLFEPDQDGVLKALLPRFLANKVWQGLLESVAAEQAARMSSMDNATKNASEMIGNLTLLYNRTRQAAITKELMEVVSGAEALK